MILPWVAVGAGFGAIAGSFLATLAIRWGRGDSVAQGRSHCDSCGIAVPAWRLMPILSFALAAGRCGACGGRIDPRQPAMETLCAVIGGVALGLQPGLEGLAGALFGWMLATLALLDLDHFWLPDALVLPLGLFGLAAGLAGLDPPIIDRLIGATAAFLVLTLIAWSYRRARGRTGLGQGDAKLLAAIGAWLGWRALPWVVLAAALVGLGWCVLLLVRGRKVSATDQLPLGTLLAIAAWPCWVIASL
jgi:leader peptidase (prepilin peptidase)/N-methyltransferase